MRTFPDDRPCSAKAPSEAHGEAFNIGGGGEPISVNSILALVAGAAGADPDPAYAGTRAGDVRMTQADVSLAERLLGFVPKVPIEEGVRRTVDWFRTSLDEGAA